MSNPLPELRGTLAQIKWAKAIRENTVFETGNPSDVDNERLKSVLNVIDSTWWIANRNEDHQLKADFKEPAPHQRLGGPPAPRDDTTKRVQRVLGEPVDPEDEPHEAEMFAEAVAVNPPLAEIAILALLSRMYTGAKHTKVRDALRHRAKCKLEDVRALMIKNIDRDIAGIRKILGKD